MNVLITKRLQVSVKRSLVMPRVSARRTIWKPVRQCVNNVTRTLLELCSAPVPSAVFMDMMEQKVGLLCLFFGSFSSKCFHVTTPFFLKLIKSFLSCFFYEEKMKMKEAKFPQAAELHKKGTHVWFKIQLL